MGISMNVFKSYTSSNHKRKLSLFSILYLIATGIAAFQGISFYFGEIWAAIILTISLITGFSLPLTIGAFFGILKVWGWHWFFAALFTFPGILFIFLGTSLLAILTSIAAIVYAPMKKRKSYNLNKEQNSEQKKYTKDKNYTKYNDENTSDPNEYTIRTYYESGNVKSEETFKDGSKIGKTKFFKENGMPE